MEEDPRICRCLIKAQESNDSRCLVKAQESNAECLHVMWNQELSNVQRSSLAEAGVLPFVNAVTYRSETSLCAVLIEFMADGQLTVGNNKLHITEEKIQEATGLPNSGPDVIPSSDYDRLEITIQLTKSKIFATNSGLLLDFIIHPLLRFAAKFLAFRLLGFRRQNYIPFKYVETAMDVARGVRFNWCKFVKERMLHQIEAIQKQRKGIFNYPTILQALAFRAFDNHGIPRNVVAEGEAYINAHRLCGRNVPKTKEQKRMINKGVSFLVDIILKKQGIPEREDDTKCPEQKRKMIDNVYPEEECKKSKKMEGFYSVDSTTVVDKASPPSLTKCFVENRPCNCLNIVNNNILASSPQPSDGVSTSFSNERWRLNPAVVQNLDNPNTCSGLELEVELCMISEEKMNEKEKEVQGLEMEKSLLLTEKASLEDEKAEWEAEKAVLEAQKMQLINEKAQTLEEREQLEMEKSMLQTRLLQEIQRTAELQRKLNKMRKFWGK